MAELSQYLFEIRYRCQEEGGGFLITFPYFSSMSLRWRNH